MLVMLKSCVSPVSISSTDIGDAIRVLLGLCASHVGVMCESCFVHVRVMVKIVTRTSATKSANRVGFMCEFSCD